MSKEFHETLDKALKNVCQDLADCKDEIRRIHGGNSDNAVGKFIEQVFEWRKDSDKAQILYFMFNDRGFYMDRALFFPSFASFLSNLHDDTYYEIHWTAVKFTEDGNMVFDQRGWPERERSTIKNPRARPQVVCSGEGSQDFQGLIDLMNLVWEREEQRRIELERQWDEI